jgi:retron-type reverse transcriptase
MVKTDDNRDIFELAREFSLDVGYRGIDAIGHNNHLSAHPLNFSAISSIKALDNAWQKFASGKKSRADVALFQKGRAGYIRKLHIDLETGKYQHGRYQPFTIFDPKQRRIHKASVRDRLVHQAIVTAIEPLFEKQFVYDSYSCRVGKGTHAGVTRLRCFLTRVSHNHTRKVYALKCDVRQYFASIDHETLLTLIEKQVSDEATLELLRTVIMSHGAEIGKGVPLGNVTSQLFANIYLHELDWYVKQRLGIRWYLRYCDDFVIISPDKLYLELLIEPIRGFLSTCLGLDLHPHKVTIRSWQQGIDFLGFVLTPHATLIRTKTKRRMYAKVDEYNLGSYLGICTHADAYRVSQTLRLLAWKRGC